MGADLGQFLLAALACGQVAKVVAESGVFARVRAHVARLSTFWGEGISCTLCVSTWAGLLIAIPIRFSDAQPEIAAWFLDGMAISLIGRTFSYAADLLRRVSD